VFISVGKGGSETATFAEALGRLTSLVLRLPCPLSPMEKVKAIIEQLGGIGGARQLGFGRERVRSLPDAVAQTLAEHIGLKTDGNGNGNGLDETAVGDMCPSCGQACLVFEEGCQKCFSCGYSEC
jgi:ribonucleoside-diphosphate reductase alpha chain